MTENMKKLLELVSKNEELAKKLENAGKEEVLALARELGIELTDADFVQNSELSEDELEAVAGGWKHCWCLAGGGGKKDSDGKACGCVAYGQGDSRDGKMRCVCAVGGEGLRPDCYMWEE